MPRFAHLDERVPCPMCGADLAYIDRIGLQWGYCDYPYSDSHGVGYQIGEAVAWRVDANGRVPAWRYFEDDTGNIGDPRVADVVIRESEFLIDRCAGCGWTFGAIGVVVRGGVIVAARLYPEWPTGVDVQVIGPGGELTPRPAWTDHVMGLTTSGGPPVQLFRAAEAQRAADPAEPGTAPDRPRL